jgi:hypothetical protein
MLEVEPRTPEALSSALPDTALQPVRSAAAALAARTPPLRQERLSGIHNPWGGAAALTNTWAFLDLCEHAALVDATASVIGPDVILWDSELYLRARDYAAFVEAGREGRYWPLDSLAGAVALVPLTLAATAWVAEVRHISTLALSNIAPDLPLYVVRYMSAARHFSRDVKLPANWRAMEEQPLINYTTRPLWLVRGEDRAGNDFVTGFAASAPRWAGR